MNDGLRAALRGSGSLALWAAAAVIGVAGTVFAVAAALAFFTGASPSAHLLPALTIGLAVLLAFGMYHLRRQSATLRVGDRDQCLARLKAVAEDLGAAWVRIGDEWGTKANFHSLLVGDGIRMHFADDHHAVLVGARWNVERFRRLYRMMAQMDKVHESLADSRRRTQDGVFKRFDLAVRVSAEQLRKFQENVVDVLDPEGDLVIDVQMLFSSDAGVRHAVWTEKVKPWLEDNGLHYEYHTDHPQRHAPPPTPPWATLTPSVADTERHLAR